MAKRRFGTKWKHMLSYVFVAALPVLVCSALMVGQRAVNDRTRLRDSAVEALSSARSRVDLVFSRMENVGLHFSQLPDALNTYAETGEDTVSGQLRTYAENYPFASGLVFLLRGGDSVVTTEGVVSYGAFIADKQGMDLDMSGFYTEVNVATTAKFLRLRRTIGSAEVSDTFVWLCPVPELSERPLGCLAFFLHSSFMEEMFEDCMGASPGLYCVLDPMLRVIWTNDGHAMSGRLGERLLAARGTGAFLAREGGTDYIFLRQISQTTGAYYLAALPTRELYASVDRRLQAEAWILCGLTALVAVLAMLVGRVFFRPLRQLANAAGVQEEEPDLFAGIRTQYARLADQNAFLRGDAERMQRLVRGPVLSELLMNGYSHSASQRSVLAGAGISFPHNGYMVALCAGAVPAGAVSAAADGCVLYPLETRPDEELAVIVNLPLPGPEQADAERERIAGAILECARRAGAAELRIGVGSVTDDLARLGDSMVEAAIALRGGDASLTLYQPEIQSGVVRALIPTEERDRLLEAAMAGRESEALSLLDGMFAAAQEMSAGRAMTITWRLFLYGTISELLEKLGQPGIGAEHPLHGFADISMDEYRAEARALLTKAMRACTPQRRQEMERERRIIAYIGERFSDPDLSLDSVAEEFGLSARTVSAVLRRVTGMSFLQYVSGMRIQYAKRLLVQSDARIKDIATAVGYLDAASFSRKFRQAEGITPQEYRDGGR